MPSTQDFTAIAHSNVDLLLALSTKAFEGAEKLAALNLQVAKDGLAAASNASSQMLSGKPPKAGMTATGSYEPVAAKASEYAAQMTAIMNETKADLDKLISSSGSDAKSAFAAMVEAAIKTAPPGSENAMALWKTAVAGATSNYEAMQKAAKVMIDHIVTAYGALMESYAKAQDAQKEAAQAVK